MTKHDRIAELIAEGMSSRTIADIIGCGTSYVRTVRQRIAGVRHDLAWRKRNPLKNRDYMRQFRLTHPTYDRDYRAKKRPLEIAAEKS